MSPFPLASEAARKTESFGNVVGVARFREVDGSPARKWRRVVSTEIEKQNVAYTFASAKAGIERGERGRPVRTIVERGTENRLEDLSR
jgi:hypothetical protein